MARLAVVATAVLLLVVGVSGPAQACDWAPALAVEDVAAAGPGGLVPFFGREVPVVGVVEYTVAAHAPALVPVTSQRSGFLRVRSWGRAQSDFDHLPPAQAGRAPYIGGIFSSCGGLRTPPADATILVALVEDGPEIDRRTIGPEAFVYHFAEGIGEDTRDDLEAAFGPATVYDHGLGERLGVTASVWTPHLLVGGGLLALGVYLVVVRRVWPKTA